MTLELSNIQRILLVKPSSLGDIVHALPVLHGLRKRFPEAHIAWLVGSSFAALIKDHPDIDEIIEFDRNRFAKAWCNPVMFLDSWAFLRKLKKGRFDLVIDLQGLLRSGIMTSATRAPIRIGFRKAREGAPWFYNHYIETPDDDAHAVKKNFLVASMLGFEKQGIRFNLNVTENERDQARTLLAEAGIEPGQEFIAILPGARWETKQWFPERFSKTIIRIRNELGLSSVLAGAPDEEPLCASIAEGCGSVNPPNLAGKTTIRQLAALLDLAKAVVCMDSAPSHLAAALDKPVITISGPTNPDRTGPYSPDAVILRADLECSPCYYRTLKKCPHEHACMKNVTVQQVIEAVTRFVRSPSPL